MIDPKLIERINKLAKKQKEVGLEICLINYIGNCFYHHTFLK